MSLATGRQETIAYFALEPALHSESSQARGPHWCQVYGSGLTQAPFASTDKEFRRRPSVFTIAQENLSLLELISAWQKRTDEHHPLLETYGAFVGDRPQHPRSHYLLLVQALEGLHGYNDRQKFQERSEAHAARRAGVLAAVRDRVENKDFRFLKDYLPSRPPTSLDTALRACLASLPIDLSEQLNSTDLVRDVLSAKRADSLAGALRVVRNDLAHGNRGYDAQSLHEVASLLDHVARAHLLKILGCGEEVQRRALESIRR